MSDDTESTAAITDMMTPELARHPQPVFRDLLAGAAALKVDGVGVIACSRAAVDEVLRQPDVFSSSTEAIDLKTRRPLIPLQIDPPAQRKFRKILDPLFSPQRMRRLEEPITALVNELIDAFVDEDEIDFTREFSIPFPSRVFLTLFGLPIEELPRFLAMKDGIIRPDHVVGHERGHPETDAHQQATADSIYEYFEGLLDERASVRRDDLLSEFLDAQIDGDRLGREDILDICFLFLIAGLDTVSASLDCFYGHLAEHPEERRKLVEDPELIAPIVEELLRWETPVMGAARVATCDSEVGGQPVSAGEQVMVLLGAANLDDRETADAGTVRWDREANRHLAFGGGVHRCLGSHLARVELRVALREWHRRIPDYRVRPGVLLDYTPGIRSLDSFPMVLRQSL
ncbi:MAG TPA: cytochrome P450 [Acidimicrobiales bacterium]|jgi:cytochrome P450